MQESGQITAKKGFLGNREEFTAPNKDQHTNGFEIQIQTTVGIKN